MQVAGFTFIRNAIRFDYPIVEAIRSVLPLCDYMVVAIGHSDDATLQVIQGIDDPKIHILETVWDDSLREGGRVLALETDKAFQAIPAHFDWCFYIQGDEVVHEKDYPAIRAALELHQNNPMVEGLLFDYRHFYGSYDYLGDSRRWYRREVRIIRNNKAIFSYRDAQGFRIRPPEKGRKLNVKPANAGIYHYGWVKNPEQQQEKQLNFNKLWHSELPENIQQIAQNGYQYNEQEPLKKFEGTHPEVMQKRVAAVNWKFSTDPTRIKRLWKDRLSGWIEKWTGWRPGEYKNYDL